MVPPHFLAYRLTCAFVMPDCSIGEIGRLHQRGGSQLYVVAKPEHYLTLIQFKFSISYCLRNLNKAREGRPKKGVFIGRIAAPKMKVRHRVGNKHRPPQCVRHDQVGHFPAPMKKRGRCKYDGCKSICITVCIKCKAYLCINRGKDCFLNFHGVQFNEEELEF